MERGLYFTHNGIPKLSGRNFGESFDMNPTSSTLDVMDGVVRNAVIFGNHLECVPVPDAFSNDGDLLGLQDGQWVIVAHQTRRAFLRSLIRHVGIVRAQEKMGRINAGWIVATMQNMKIVLDLPIFQLPGDAVGVSHSAIVPNISVPFRVSRTLPFPALIGAAFVYLCHESFSQGRSNKGGANGRAALVGIHKSLGRASDKTFLCARHWRNGGIAAASTLAFAIGSSKTVNRNPRSIFSYVLGKLRGTMLLHQKLAFLVSCLGTFRDVAGAISIGLLPLHYSTFERVAQR